MATSAKRLSTDRTLVLRLEAILADLNLRNTVLKDSEAIRVDAAYRSGDVILQPEASHDLGQVSKCVVIHAFMPFAVVITQAGQSVTLQSSGMFVYTGQAEHIEVRASALTEPTRFRYLSA